MPRLASPDRATRALGFALAALATACSGGNAASVVAKPPEYAPAGQTKCGVRASQASPLIVEWPAAARAELESASKRGLVVVRYEGCEMQVLSRCKAPGAYEYTPTTRQRDRLAVRDADELYAKLPLGAASLESALARSGELAVAMTIVGTYQADASSVGRDQLSGQCAGATHVVSALTAGAFELSAGADAEVGGGVNVGPVGGGARSTAKRETLNQAGEESACAASTASDAAPPFGCGALLRVEVVALGPAAAPPIVADSPPPGEPPPAKPESAPPDARGETARVGGSETETPTPSDRPAPSEPPRSSRTESPAWSDPTPPPPPDSASNTPWIVGGVVALVAVVVGVGVLVAVTKEEQTAPELPQHGLGSGTVRFAPRVTW